MKKNERNEQQGELTGLDPSGGDYLEAGVDEMNLVEFPLSAISERIACGQKSLTFEETIFDRNERRMVQRRLTLSGSDRYGLPIASDEDVLLACIQLTKLNGYASPEVRFSRYELLKLLAWPDITRNYQRLSQSLRRWKGLSVFSDRAFYDHAAKSWVNRDFGIFDNLVIYHRESTDGRVASKSSRFTWNEVLFNSFDSGYLKKLDWPLYLRLTSPLAKRLYRFLDKRFYHRNHVTIDLHDLAWLKMRMSANYNTAQIKRALLKGIQELQSQWELKQLPASQQFEKVGKGRWIVRFERKRSKRSMAGSGNDHAHILDRFDVATLCTELTKRGIGPAAAEEIVDEHPSGTVKSMIELFDWYNLRGQNRGAGFLVQAIRQPNKIAFPTGFESSQQIADRKAAEKSRNCQARDLVSQREAKAREETERRQAPFTAFWNGLSPHEQQRFEEQALDHAEPTKRRGYLTHQGREGRLFDHYRTIILRDHFERTTTR